MTLAWWDMWGCVRCVMCEECDVIYVGNAGMVRCVRVWVYLDNRRERVMHWRNGACNLAYLLHSNTNQLTKLCHSSLSGNNELCKVTTTCAQWVVVRDSGKVLALTVSLSGLRTRPTTGGPTLSLSFCEQDFRVEFHFSENEYFTNPVLTKLYKVSITYFSHFGVYWCIYWALCIVYWCIYWAAHM